MLILLCKYAEVVELADAPDSKSGDGDIVRVQVPPSAPPQGSTRLLYFPVLLKTYADVAELADALDSGSSESLFSYGFKSLHLHQTRIIRTREKILSSYYFLQKIILA